MGNPAPCVRGNQTVPSSCRANDGTELVGRYDRRMDEWLPLFGPTITAVGALGVALWNSRGESRDVRQLKAMNDVIAGLPETSDATRAFIDARDGMLVRVAAGVASLPRRRRITWIVIAVTLGAAAVAFVGWLLAPLLSSGTIEMILFSASLIVGLTGVVVVFWSFRGFKSLDREIARDIAEMEKMVHSFNEARRRAVDDE